MLVKAVKPSFYSLTCNIDQSEPELPGWIVEISRSPLNLVADTHVKLSQDLSKDHVHDHNADDQPGRGARGNINSYWPNKRGASSKVLKRCEKVSQI